MERGNVLSQTKVGIAEKGSLIWYTVEVLISAAFSRYFEREDRAKKLVYQINVPKQCPALEFRGIPPQGTHGRCTLLRPAGLRGCLLQ
jgi:hypothetical protein